MARGFAARKPVVLTALAIAFVGCIIPQRYILFGKLQQPQGGVSLVFRVLDGETSRPIRKASVRLVGPFEDEDRRGRDETSSDDRGIAVLTQDFESGEILNKLRDGDRVKVAGWRVEVSATAYLPCATPLFEYTGDELDTRKSRSVNVYVRLYRRTAAGRMPVAAAEKFVRRDWGRHILFMSYEDKFYSKLSVPKLCSEHTPWFETARGHAEEKGGKLSLSIAAREEITRIDGREDNWFLNDLVRVRWGGRQYLISEGQFAAFCNAVNQGEEPRNDDYGDFYLGEGHEKIKVAGLPEVPEPWGRFLLKAPVQGRVIEVLPDLKAKVDVGMKDGIRIGMELVPTEESLFSAQVVVSVEEGGAIVKTKYPDGMYRKVRPGDLVSTKRPADVRMP